MTGKTDRRPLASRDTGWARWLTRKLAATEITPNQISMGSMVAAAVAGAAFWGVFHADGAARVILLLLAATGCQLRLLCNLMDGLVAIEAGKQTADGAFWNEFPDRVADVVILAGLGLAAGLPALGWAAATLAVCTAYVRELGRACGLPADYSGPMAKPHRMAAVTLAAVLATLEPLWSGRGDVLAVALWLIVAGTALTVILRARRLLALLRTR